jgi:hypothetical protein
MNERLRRRFLVVGGAALAAGVAAGALIQDRLRLTVREALQPSPADRRPLEFVAAPASGGRCRTWGGGETDGLAMAPGVLWTAGAFGVSDGERTYDTTNGLPTLRASSITLWRGQPIVALAAGGLVRFQDGVWAEARSGWGRIQARAVVETAAGELLIGAREGLFRAAWGGGSLERLDVHPVRSVAVADGYLLAGGEEGLYRIEPGRAVRLETPDPWVDWVAFDESVGDIVVLTAAGLARGRARVSPLAGGEDVTSAALHRGQLFGLVGDTAPAVRRFTRGGRVADEGLPAPARRLMIAADTVFADTTDGLYRRAAGRWTLTRRRPTTALPAGSVHVGALARQGERLLIGLFDGGLVVGDPDQGRWRTVPGSSAWGVNALLPAGGAVYVASLRGAARFDGERLRPVAGPGAAFSLTATGEGVAIGYGQGVLLPGARLLSAFHGLPGNQALALAWSGSLFVGTPSGLGAVEGHRVRWRVAQGEGRLPNPWVTALLFADDSLFVGTYGGGVARRRAPAAATTSSWSEAGSFEPFVETAGLKVNPGCLAEAGGRIYAGTDGGGVYRLSPDGRRFEPLSVALPSSRITALLPGEGVLYIGTDQGLARLVLDGDGSPSQESS